MTESHNRVELDPPQSTQPNHSDAVPPEAPEARRAAAGEGPHPPTAAGTDLRTPPESA